MFRTYQEVRLIEVIRHIPANLSVLASLLYHSVEEGQDINQTAESWVSTAHQLVVRDLEIRCPHVQLQPIWRFCNNLKAKNRGVIRTLDNMEIKKQTLQETTVLLEYTF